MKKFFAVGLFFVLLLSICVSADKIIVSKGTIELGSDSQDRSNDDEDVYKGVSTTFNVQNNDTINWTSFSITSSAESKYNVTFQNMPATLGVGESKTITIKAKVPADLDSVDDDGDETAVGIGNAQISFTGGSTNIPMTMQAENKLEIYRIYISVNDGSEKSYSDEKTVEKLKPGDTISIRVELKNKFSTRDEEDFSIDSAVRIEAATSDFDFDDEDLDFGDIDATDKGSEETTFEIDEEIDESTYSVDFIATGDDENNAKHGEKWSIEFEVEREKYEIDIRDLTLDPETIDNCADRSVDLKVEIKNIGSNDDDEIVIKVSSPGLQYSSKIDEIELDTNDEETHRFRIPVTKDTVAGDYFIEVNTYYKDDEGSHNDDAKLTVTQCKTIPIEEEEEETPEEEGEAEETEVVIIGEEEKEEETEITPIIAGTQPIATVEGGFSGSMWYIVIIIAAIVIAVASLVLTITLLAKGKKSE